MKEYRTDLAIELEQDMDNLSSGVVITREGSLTTVEIQTKEAGKKLGKTKGKYLTLELSGEKEDEREMKKAMKELGADTWQEVVIVGLGNREMTPDRIGPETIKRLRTHNKMKAIAPGVMGQTGMETADVIKGIVSVMHPEGVILIDSLAAREPHRLFTTLQLTNTGISPGGGVGNHRKEMNTSSLGIPVLAMGIPTVIDYREEGEEEIHYYLTPSHVDEEVFSISERLAHALNALYPVE